MLRLPQGYLIDDTTENGMFRFLHNKHTFYVVVRIIAEAECIRITISGDRKPTIDECYYVKRLFWDDKDPLCIFMHSRETGPNTLKNSVYLWKFKDAIGVMDEW